MNLSTQQKAAILGAVIAFVVALAAAFGVPVHLPSP